MACCGREMWRSLFHSAGVVACFIVLAGWQPSSRESLVEEVSKAEASVAEKHESCWPYPYRSADLVLLWRRQYRQIATSWQNTSRWPAQWGLHQAAEARRCAIRSASEVTAFHQVLANSAHLQRPGELGGAEIQEVQTQWVGRERALGPILHSLVPLLWWAAHNDSFSRTAAAGIPSSGKKSPDDLLRRPFLLRPPVLHLFAGSRKCANAGYSVACFLQPEGGQLSLLKAVPPSPKLYPDTTQISGRSLRATGSHVWNGDSQGGYHAQVFYSTPRPAAIGLSAPVTEGSSPKRTIEMESSNRNQRSGQMSYGRLLQRRWRTAVHSRRNETKSGKSQTNVGTLLNSLRVSNSSRRRFNRRRKKLREGALLNLSRKTREKTWAHSSELTVHPTSARREREGKLYTAHSRDDWFVILQFERSAVNHSQNTSSSDISSSDISSSNWSPSLGQAHIERTASHMNNRRAHRIKVRLRRDETVPPYFEYSRHAAAALPRRWAKHGLFWLVSHTLSFMLQPNPILRARIDAQVRALGLRRSWNRPILAVHARRIENCPTYRVMGRKRSCDPLEAYVDEARKLISSHGFRSILFISDSPAALRNASVAFAPLGVRVLQRADALTAAQRAHTAEIKDSLFYAQLRENRKSRKQRVLDSQEVDDGYERALDYLIDVHLIALSDGFVGKFSSNRARMGYSLMAARPPFFIRPFVSLDIPWCFGFACRKEGNEELKKHTQRRSAH